ncbi:TPA: iron-sulfur cluster carrier protein ApbC, partial [Legionella pneumophila]|nr:iron-sulfur cluster carrier protein ApbC [Legionella pneumophila]
MTIEDTVIKLIGSLKDPLLDLTGKEMNLQYKITTSNQA